VQLSETFLGTHKFWNVSPPCLHPYIVCSWLHIPTKFKCAKTWGNCSNTDFKIAHAKMGGGVLSGNPFFACAIFSEFTGVELMTSKSHMQKWVVVFMSY
jgi:hypothetical protein